MHIFRQAFRRRANRVWPRIAAAAAVVLIVAACDQDERESYDDNPDGVVRARAMSPTAASVNCKRAGGILAMEKRGDGGEFGVCHFHHRRQCEEWAMLLGLCPAGGLDVSAYPAPAARYCVLRGGHVAAANDASGKSGPGACSLPGGKSCPADDLYNGSCGNDGLAVKPQG